MLSYQFSGIQDEDLYQAYGEVLKTFKLKGMENVRIIHMFEVLLDNVCYLCIHVIVNGNNFYR